MHNSIEFRSGEEKRKYADDAAKVLRLKPLEPDFIDSIINCEDFADRITKAFAYQFHFGTYEDMDIL